MSNVKFENEGNGKKYTVKIICNSAVYASKSKGHLPGLYYLVLWKSYSKEENIWEPTLVVLHLRKLISIFYHDHPEKQTATSLSIDFTSPMAWPIVKPTETLNNKQKWDRLAKDNSTSKCIKKRWTFNFYLGFDFISTVGKVSLVTCP